MDNSIKKRVRSFLKDFDLQTVTLENLRGAIQKQGYTIIEFNNIYNNENVDILLNALELEEYCKRSKGFTYADSKRRLVFLHEDLSQEEKLIVLAHEEGHIYCNHLGSVPVLGRDVVEEYEANEFAHYLLHQGIGQRVNQFVRKRKKVVFLAVAVLVLVIAIGFIRENIKWEHSYYGEFYITSTGNKYHEKDCIFVKNKDNVERLTNELYESNEYEPCNICLPQGSE